MSKRINGDLNIFGNVDYEKMIEEMYEKSDENLHRIRGFTYCGIYVTGTSETEFKRLLDDLNWMKF